MADKRQFFDLWIIETNTVYKQVPYSVVTDWVQEGRLLPSDKLRAPGTENWVLVSDLPAVAPYLPRVEPHRAEDQAEALEPVQVDFSWKPSRGEEDDDVDMIPLIDISLVLLIFFMMTAAVGGAGALFNTPPAENKLISNTTPDDYWIGVRNQNGKPVYSVGKGDKGEVTEYDSREAFLQGLADKLQEKAGPSDIRIRADKTLSYKVAVKDLTVELGKLKERGKVGRVFFEVSKKEQP